jgi:hypothetical protein
MTPLPTTEVLLLPQSRGRIDGGMAETEIIKRYARALSDELDHCAIRHRLGDSPRPWELTISLGLGWTEAKKDLLTNRSRIWISDARASSLASLLAETLSHWGHTYIGLEHRSCKPVALQEEVAHVSLQPFQLNGLKAGVYAQKLEELGRDLGRTIADYIAKEKGGGMVKMTKAADLPQNQSIRRIF